MSKKLIMVTGGGGGLGAAICSRADQLGYRMEEVPVTWADAGGSRVWLPRDGFKALRDAWMLRTRFRRKKLMNP